MDDLELLRRYAKDGCPQSFEAIVRRHIDWVYWSCVRQIGGGDHEVAEDVTQSVFVLLARKAAHLPKDTSLSGWLFNTLRFMCRSAKRDQHRRRRHEAGAAISPQQAASPAVNLEQETWERIAPLLDEAVASLRESERQIVLLRFYEGEDFAQIAAALGITVVAARQRLSRAVRRLGQFFKRRGIIVPATALVLTLLARTASAAPAALSQTVLCSAAGAASVSLGVRGLLRKTSRRAVHVRKRLAAAIVAAMIGLSLWLSLIGWLAGGADETTPWLPRSSADTQAELVLLPPPSQWPQTEVPQWDLSAPQSHGRLKVGFEPYPPRATNREIPQIDPLWWVRATLEQQGARAMEARKDAGTLSSPRPKANAQADPQVAQWPSWWSWFGLPEPVDSNDQMGLGGGPLAGGGGGKLLPGATGTSETLAPANRAARGENVRGGAAAAGGTFGNASGDARVDTSAATIDDSSIAAKLTAAVSGSLSSPPQLAWRANLMNTRSVSASASGGFDVITTYHGGDVVHEAAIVWGASGVEQRSITSVIFAPLKEHAAITITGGGTHGPTVSFLGAGDAELPAADPVALPALEQVLFLPDSLLPDDVDLSHLSPDQVRQLVGPYIKDPTAGVSLGRLDESGHLTWALAPEPGLAMGALGGLMLMNRRCGRRR